jgi:hypothetical protein
MWPMPLHISEGNAKTLHIKSRTNNGIAMLSAKETLYPGGIRTRVFCFWGEKSF